MSTSMVSVFRKDVFETKAGPEELYCACSFHVPCLYHWYYEVKMDGAMTPPALREKMNEQFPGRKPERDPGPRRGKHDAPVGDAAVRRHRSPDRDGAGKFVRGHGRRG